jgi:hypothetical protein
MRAFLVVAEGAAIREAVAAVEAMGLVQRVAGFQPQDGEPGARARASSAAMSAAPTPLPRAAGSTKSDLTSP